MSSYSWSSRAFNFFLFYFFHIIHIVVVGAFYYYTQLPPFIPHSTNQSNIHKLLFFPTSTLFIPTKILYICIYISTKQPPLFFFFLWLWVSDFAIISIIISIYLHHFFTKFQFFCNTKFHKIIAINKTSYIFMIIVTRANYI